MGGASEGWAACLRRMLSTHSGLGSVLLALLGLWWKPGLVCRALGGRELKSSLGPGGRD